MSNQKTSLWHYTTLAGLQGILLGQCLWATDYRYLNDEKEFVHSRQIILPEILPRIRDTIADEYERDPSIRQRIDDLGGVKELSVIEANDTVDILYRSLFDSPSMEHIACILSFCEVNADDSPMHRNGLLSQWRGYGKDGGYALVFNKKSLLEAFKQEQESYYHGLSGHGEVIYAANSLSEPHEIRGHLDFLGHFSYRVYRTQLYGDLLNKPEESLFPFSRWRYDRKLWVGNLK